LPNGFKCNPAIPDASRAAICTKRNGTFTCAPAGSAQGRAKTLDAPCPFQFGTLVCLPPNDAFLRDNIEAGDNACRYD
jgi:hypothetical protein